MDEGSNEKKSHTSPTHTREQVAKLSGVGTGTVARYDAIITTRNEKNTYGEKKSKCEKIKK